MAIEELYDRLDDILDRFGNELHTMGGYDYTRFKSILLGNCIIIKESEYNKGMSVVNNIDNVCRTSITIYSRFKTLENSKNVYIFSLSEYDKVLDLVIDFEKDTSSNSFTLHDRYRWIKVIDDNEYKNILNYINDSKNSDKEKFDKLKDLRRDKSLLEKSVSNLLKSIDNFNKMLTNDVEKV